MRDQAASGLYRQRVRILLFLLSSWVGVCEASSSLTPQTVSFNSGEKTLQGLLYKPDGDGPFPAILFNHGSAPRLLNNMAFDAIGPMFVSQGWVFFAPYRRGQGLSSKAGPYIMDEIEAARTQGGMKEAAKTMVRLLSTDHLDDQLAAFNWIKVQPYVRAGHIAVMGNSFGGIETVLGAEKAPYCAAVDISGGAESWDKAPELRQLMLQAVVQSQAPILFLQAQNDYSVAPSRELYAAMHAKHKSAEIQLYPPFGKSPQEGHSFAYRAVDIWGDDVLRFLQRNCKP